MLLKKCRQCTTSFTITDHDFQFYKNLSVPEPTHCPNCRQQQRLAWRNESVLYSRSCDLCHKTIISTYSADPPRLASGEAGKPFPVYCQDCFWSDRWNSLDYGEAFDATVPFFEQLGQLFNRVPHVAIINKQSENSDYCNYSFANKNCYLTFGNHYEENCLYGRYSTKNRDCMDYVQCYQNELCYQCVYTGKSYHCFYVDHCTDCQNCYFSFDLKGCKDCLFSANLHNKQYYIFNQPYSKEAYEQKLQKLQLHTRTGVQQALHVYREQVQQRFPRRANYQVNCEQSTGNNLQHSKNLAHCFDSAKCEDCAYGFQMDETYTSMDMNCMGYDRSELCYQTIGCTGLYNAIACSTCWHSRDMFYSCFCFSSNNCFGSMSLQKQQYCILNKQYTEAEYKQLTQTIIAELRKNGTWGEFLPAHLSPFGYNETVAFEHFPLTQYVQSERPQQANTATVPDSIDAVTDDITKTTLICEHCQKAYRIVQQELKLYRQLHLSIPRWCANCRAQQRLTWRNPMQLWQRQCCCIEVGHDHTQQCSMQFETTYSPERKEQVYCEQCYRKVIY